MTDFSTYIPYDEQDNSEKKEQYAKLAELGEAVKAVLDAAMEYARQHQLEFYFSPEYGMGGTFSGKERGWEPSSGSC